MAPGRSRAILFDDNVSKIQKRLVHWDSKLLSTREKIILLKYVLQVIPMFLLQVRDRPKIVVMQLYRIFNAFLWDKNTKEIILRWTSWEKICCLKEGGGLGMRLLEDSIDAFSMKLSVQLRLKKDFGQNS